MKRFFTDFLGHLIQIAPFAFLCLYPFNRHFRFSKRKTCLLTALLVTGSSIAIELTVFFSSILLPEKEALYFRIRNGMFLFAMLLCLFWYFYAVKAIMAKKLFVLSFILSNTFTVNSIYNYFFAHRNVSSASNGPGFLLRYSLVLCVYVPLLLLFLKRLYMPVEESLNVKESRYLTVLSVFLSVLMVNGVLFFDYDFLRANPMVLFLFLFLMAAVIFVYFIFLRMYYVIHKSHQIQQESMQMQHQIELRDEQYQRIYETMENSRKMRHDLKHHLLTLKGFLDDGDILKAEEYLKQYFEDIRKYEIVRFCDNQVVNMLVSYYYSLAGENGTELAVHINIPKELSIQTPDLSILLGNLLGNAIDGTSTVPAENRTIRLHMLCRGNMLVVTVDNSFDGKAIQNAAGYLSTKQGHGGLGLKSLADIAQKYDGGAEFTHDEKEFHASVMLCI